MASISYYPRYVCQRCIQDFSRQYSKVCRRPQSRPRSTNVTQHASGAPTYQDPKIRLRSFITNHDPRTIKKDLRTGPYVSTKHKRADVERKSTPAFGEIVSGERQGRTRASTRSEEVTREERVRLTSFKRALRKVPQERARPETQREAGWGGTVKRPLRRLLGERIVDELLIPSTPSAPLASKPQEILPPVYAPEPAPTHRKLHFANQNDFNWYFESYPPTIAQQAQATHFFQENGKNAKILRSVAQFRMFPESDVPEVAFVGRSNVGKSSLLNAVVNADFKSLLARTSATRGFTKTMNMYGIGPGNGVNIKSDSSGRDKVVGLRGLTIVDMPGYGAGSLASWGVEIMKYIQSRKQLRRVFVLLDAEHGIKDKDRSLLASLRLAGVSHQIILSKLDKLYIPEARTLRHYDGKLAKRKPKGSVEELRRIMETLVPDIKPPVGGGALGEILACSAETLVDGKRLGIDHVRFAVLKAVGLEIGANPDQVIKFCAPGKEVRR